MVGNTVQSNASAFQILYLETSVQLVYSFYSEFVFLGSAKYETYWPELLPAGTFYFFFAFIYKYS